MSIIENVTATAPDGTTQTVGKLDCSTEFAVLTLENKSADSYILSGFIRSEGNGSFYVEGVKTLPTSPTWQSFSIIVPANVSQLKITFENDIYYIYKWLFEQGNKQTSWAPSPNDIESRMTNAESSIKQNADNIALKVDVDGVITAINLAKGEATINANKINLNGVVTANETFKILEDGSMEATGGTIGGWNIEKQRLYGESEEQPETGAFYRVSLARPYTYDPRHNVFLVEQIGEGTALLAAITAGGQALFSSLNVTGNTSLYGDVYCTGNIKAKNFERGTLEVVVENATVYVTKEIPLSFTPTETTQCVLSLRTVGSPQPRYLNCWANYYKPNAEATPYLFACMSAGGSSASTVPAGTYYIDYIAANV